MLPKKIKPTEGTASLEALLIDFTSNIEQPFDLEEVMHHLEKSIDAKKHYHFILGLLQKDPWIFWDTKKESGIPRSCYFNNVQFRMLPRLEEIDKGVLIPGHRFFAFCSKLILPFDCKLFWQNKNIDIKNMEWIYTKSIVYHTLMGISGVISYLSEQNQQSGKKNKKEKEKDIFETMDIWDRNGKINLKVYNLHDFYKKNNFKEGDSILLTVIDWKKGIYKIEYSPQSVLENNQKLCMTWVKKLETALEKVIKEKKDIKEINEQLAYAFFMAGKEIFDLPGYHIGGFLAKSSKIEISNYDLSVSLAIKSKKNKDTFSNTDLVKIMTMDGNKESESLEEFLQSIQYPITASIIRMIMMDELYRKSDDWARILLRCHQCSFSWHFEEEEQEKKFYALIKELWDEIKKKYDYNEDKEISEGRSHCLSLFEKANQFLEQIPIDDKSFIHKLKSIDSILWDLQSILFQYNLGSKPTKQELENNMKKMNELEKLFEILQSDSAFAEMFGFNKKAKAKTAKKNVAKKSAEKKPSEICVYQLKISLLDTDPPVWRRVLVKSNTSLEKLHDIIQDSMGWEDCHLHAFDINRVSYGPEEENDESIVLSDLIEKEKQKFQYTYDFGDSWEHKIVVEKILPIEKGKKYPICIDGENACPPEDCGGLPGYYSLLEAIEDPKNPEHEEMLEWIGTDFNPSSFNLKEINKRLKN